jgi:hypothetical protein
LNKPKQPKPSPASVALEQRQIADLSRLDEEQNVRVKRILRSKFGFRGFAGGPLTRGAPGNSAGAAAAAAPGAMGGGAGMTSGLDAYARGGRAA